MSRHSTETASTLIGLMRESNWTMRSIASVVILTFGGLVTSPAVAAVKQEIQQVQQQKAAEGPGSRFSANMKSIKEHLAATLKTPKGTSLADMKRQLNTDTVVLAASDREMLDGFDSVRTMIKDKHLPDVIMQRELAAEKHYNTEMSALKQGLTAIVTENDDAKAQAKSKDVLDRLSQFQDERKAQKFDPKNLPNRSLKPDLSRKPHKTKKEFAEAGFISNPRLMVATTAPNFDYSQLPGANDPAYLAATTEVTLSPAIQAQAAALNYNPVQIYNWVRNNVQWQPTWGAVQNADLTLSAQRGNAFDISSLLIALLRASNIPARYVHGTIDVPEAKFRNWVGGFQDINAAVNYASAGGIPITSLVSGGKVTTIQMEHIWVEAAIDYIPSMGAVNKLADTWVPMDASYKQYSFQTGLNPIAIGGIDTQQLNASPLASATTDPSGNWISGVNTSSYQTTLTQATQAVQEYVSQNLPNVTNHQILGGSTTIVINSNGLSASLANQIVVIGARYGTLPNQLEQTITFSLGEDGLGKPENPTTFPWASLNNHEIILSFTAATPNDQRALQALLPAGPINNASQLPTSIPAYLVNVIPNLDIDGKTVLQCPAMSLGQEMTFVFTPNFAGRNSIENTYNVIAGSYLDVAVIAGNVGPSTLTAVSASLQQTSIKLQSQNVPSLQNFTQAALFGDPFYAGMLGYYTQYTSIASVVGLPQGGREYLAGGIGSYGYEPQVNYTFGIANAIYGGGIVMNVPIVNVFGYDGTDVSARTNYVFQAGILSSILEAAVPVQMLSTQTQQAQAVSAATLLSLANAQGQKIYSITTSNASNVIPQISHNSGVMQDIQNAIAAGKTVITHASDITTAGWTGSGYIILDPSTGDGAYKIGGGENGSASTFLTGVFAGGAGAALFLAVFSSLTAVVSPLIFVLLISLILAYSLLLPYLVERSDEDGQAHCFDVGFDVGASLVSLIAGFNGKEYGTAISALVGGIVGQGLATNSFVEGGKCLQ